MRKRTPICSLIAGIVLMSLPADAAPSPSCEGQPGWASREITGKVRHPDPFLHEAGMQTFVLTPSRSGWRIGMLDSEGLDIPVFAAPRHPVETSPLNLAGWHFRNRDNTAPNTGDVNAPQHQRRFTFGTLAIDAAGSGVPDPETASERLGGLGVLTIDDFTLTSPVPGERAAFTSLAFTVCLIWQGGGDRLAPIVDADPAVAFERAAATVRGCGLDTTRFAISDRMAKGREGVSHLEPDMDGDGIPDLVVPVARRDDGAPGLAICLIGTETLVLAGYGGRIGRHLDPAYFGRADGWGIHTGPIGQSPEEGVPPQPAADAVRLSKDDSSSVLLFLRPDLTVSSYWQGD